MVVRRPRFDPQAGYVVTAANDFVNFNEQTFVNFYQPILGSVAFGLFYALRSRMLDSPTLSERRLQSELLVAVNAGQKMVGEALQRLEGTGMVQTYYRHDRQGDVYVYQLQSTLTPEQFISDNLLSVLLLEAIGESRFNRLVKYSRRHQLATDNVHLKNISHHFLETYQVDQRELVEVPAVIKQAQRSAQKKNEVKIVPTSSDFDWPTLLQLLHSQPIIKDDLTHHRELIEVEHRLYGIDEPTMARLIQSATDLASNHFDTHKFKQIVASHYHHVKASSTSQSKAVQQVSTSKDLTSKDRLLLKSTADYAPVEFLQALKEQTGGYVTAGERNVLTRLVKDGKLPSSVINVLVWYVIGDLGNATLKGNFVDAIANDWLRAGVHDGAGALLQLKKFNRAKQTGKKQSTGHRYYRRLQVREKMPEWSKQSKEQRNKKASAQALAQARAYLHNKH
jgi:replication initiation and membrane attachment protein